MGNTVKNNVGSSAVAQSTETIEGIPVAKSSWDIQDLCNKASDQNEEYFQFVFDNKKYSALLEKTYLIAEIVNDDEEDLIGKVDTGGFPGVYFDDDRFE